jgi:hypothetical protein
MIRATSAIITQQIFFHGRILDAVTSRPTLTPPTATLFYAPASDGRPYPLFSRIRPNGQFLFAGSPYTTFPILQAGQTLNLHLRVTALSYVSQTLDINLSDGDLMRVDVNRTLAGQAVTIPQLNVPLWSQDVLLDPLPLQLRLRVVQADDPTVPIDRAEARITAPSASGPFTSNADGYVTIPSLPLAQAVTVRVTRSGFDALETDILLDYRQQVNQRQFALES